MEWDRLICDLRLGMEEYHDGTPHTRSDFQRDYDRLVFSSPFRRLQNKTPVFPLPGSIFVHNRLDRGAIYGYGGFNPLEGEICR